MIKKQITKRGFTLVELLVALSIGTAIVLMTSLVFVQGVRHTHVVTAETRVVKASTTLVETMTYHIRSAQSVTVVDVDHLELVSSDGSSVTIRLVGDELRIQDRNILDSKIEVTSLIFTEIDNTIEIQYELDTQLLEQPLNERIVITRRN